LKTIILNPEDDISLVLKSHQGQFIKILLNPGVYHQKLEIDINDLVIEGIGNGETIITNSDYANMTHYDGLNYGTFRTPTVTILSDRVLMKNITIKNEAGLGCDHGQAVALALYGDKITLDNVRVIANQDTLFLGPLPVDPLPLNTSYLEPKKLNRTPKHHCIKNSYIEGNVDFIFGSSTTLFYNTTIVANDFGYITAPSTFKEVKYGFIFLNCIINNTSNHEIFLSRPWRNHAKNIFYNCQFNGLIHPNRYDDWDKSIFHFYEYPYIQSKYSQPLNNESINQLFKYLKENFNIQNNF
jgi:pectinesterase